MDNKQITIRVAVTALERQAIREAAKITQRTLSAFVRRAALRMADKIKSR